MKGEETENERKRLQGRVVKGLGRVCRAGGSWEGTAKAEITASDPSLEGDLWKGMNEVCLSFWTDPTTFSQVAAQISFLDTTPAILNPAAVALPPQLTT